MRSPPKWGAPPNPAACSSLAPSSPAPTRSVSTSQPTEGIGGAHKNDLQACRRLRAISESSRHVGRHGNRIQQRDARIAEIERIGGTVYLSSPPWTQRLIGGDRGVGVLGEITRVRMAGTKFQESDAGVFSDLRSGSRAFCWSTGFSL